jgi:hypothetical protein
MCTSFTYRGADIITAMNFDNNGMEYKLSTANPNQFTVLVNGAPSFGVNKDGVFVNHLMVDGNENGLYRRGKNIIHSIQLIKDILDCKINADDIRAYLDKKEIVNVPNYSAHCMITDAVGNTWVIEPGRGISYSSANNEPYTIMTNFSICDYKKGIIPTDCGYDRYEKVDVILNNTNTFDVSTAFRVLNATRQIGTWNTEFSLVYSQNEKAVYYCYNGNYDKLEKYSFERYHSEE